MSIDPNMQFGPVEVADIRDAMWNLDIDDAEWSDDELMEMIREDPNSLFYYT